MVRQEVMVAAVVVDEPILQRKGVQPATRLDIPRDLLGLRREPALRHVLFDDDYMVVLAKCGGDAVTIEGLQRVT